MPFGVRDRRELKPLPLCPLPGDRSFLRLCRGSLLVFAATVSSFPVELAVGVLESLKTAVSWVRLCHFLYYVVIFIDAQLALVELSEASFPLAGGRGWLEPFHICLLVVIVVRGMFIRYVDVRGDLVGRFI